MENIAELYEDLFLRFADELSKSSIVRAPLREYPRSGARTIGDFELIFRLTSATMFSSLCVTGNTIILKRR